MRPGSLVECIDNSLFSQFVHLNTPYTVESICNEGSILCKIENSIVMTDFVGIYLEETKGIIDFHGVKVDAPFPIEFFRELLPPMENMMEQVNELLEPALV